MVESVKPSDELFVVVVVDNELFGVHVPVLALCALFGLAARGLGYDFAYGDDGNCPRECKSPIDAVARRTPIRAKSAMSSIAAGSTCDNGG